jgi:hypothetical protein
MTDINRDTGESGSQRRAQWARRALDAYARTVYGGRTFDRLEAEGADEEKPHLGEDYD